VVSRVVVGLGSRRVNSSTFPAWSPVASIGSVFAKATAQVASLFGTDWSW
jgi:hypothetical protein